MTTSTMNLESLVSFDHRTPGLFSEKHTQPPSRPTRVHFFPELGPEHRVSKRYSTQFTFSGGSSRRKKSTARAVVKYHSAMDYLMRRRPSKSRGRSAVKEEIDFDLWHVAAPKKFPYLRESTMGAVGAGAAGGVTHKD